MRIFLTGGTGFLGRHLLPALLRQGHQIHLLVRPTSQTSRLPAGDITLFQGDVCRPESLLPAMQGCQATIHAAGLFRFWGPAGRFHQINAQGTQNVLQAALACRLPRLIYISTVVVIGKTPSGLLTEQTRCQPLDPYQQSKLEAEQIILRQTSQGNLDAIILRPGAFYGPGSHYGFNRLFIDDPMRGLLIQVDRGKHTICPAYIEDVAHAAILALNKGRAGEIYHICGECPSHKTINQIVSRQLGIPSWRVPIPKPLVLGLAWLEEAVSHLTGKEPFYPLNLRHYVFQDWRVSSQKAARELNFIPIPLEQGLAKTIAWYRKTHI